MKTNIHISLFVTGMIFLIFMSVNSFTQNPWDPTANMSTARWGHSMCALDGKIYAIGGSDNLYSPAFATAEVYDPILDTWMFISDMLIGRVNFSTCVFNGKIYAIGGGSSYYSGGALNTIEEYDPATDTWTYTTDMPRARWAHSASLVNGKIYIIGGSDGFKFVEVDVYDILTNTWTQVADLPTRRYQLAAAVINEKIYVMGGVSYPGYLGTTKVEEYNTVTDTWTTKANLITKKKMFAACGLNGKVYTLGGTSGNETPGLSSMEEYNPATNTWKEKTNMPYYTCGNAAVLFDGEIYVSGGNPDPPPVSVLKWMFAYDPLSDPLGINVLQETTFAQTYPNPFTTSTNFEYYLQQPSSVQISIFNHLGEQVADIRQQQTSGKKHVTWNAEGQHSGVYFYRILAGDQVTSGKIILVK